eukprot:2453096-Rhodomonas_salina.1
MSKAPFQYEGLYHPTPALRSIHTGLLGTPSSLRHRAYEQGADLSRFRVLVLAFTTAPSGFAVVGTVYCGTDDEYSLH